MKKSLFALFLGLFAFNLMHAVVSPYVVVTASNDPKGNELLVYSADGTFLQAISTGGKGGVGPNIVGGGIARYQNLVAVINYDSNSVSLFKQKGNSFTLTQVFPTVTKPVSLAFGHGHLYVLGTSTVESHKLDGERVVPQLDGSTALLIGDGSAAQVGVLPNHLIISERSNAISLVELQNGVVKERKTAVELPPPPRNDTPVGLVTKGDAAYVTIAHSDEVGLVKNGKLVSLISSQTQKAPCWLTLYGTWLYCSNTPSRTVSRYDVKNDALTLAVPVAASFQTGPSDIDADNGILAVLETGNNTARVSQFLIDEEGNLKLLTSSATAKTANGVAVVKLQPQQGQ